MTLQHVALGDPHVQAHNDERDAIAAAYIKPGTGIPLGDLSPQVQSAIEAMIAAAPNVIQLDPVNGGTEFVDGTGSLKPQSVFGYDGGMIP